MSRDKILVVGGYGNVGEKISTGLSNYFPGNVVAAGRNLGKASALANKSKGKIIARKLDLAQPFDYSVFTDVKVVVMCLDWPDNSFAMQCLEQGIHYVDISATYSLLSEIKRLDLLARSNKSSAILSVGLAPGLTNLLAKESLIQTPGIDQLDIFILLGLGEKHGSASLQWVMDNLRSSFFTSVKGKLRSFQSFQESREVVFPNEPVSKKAYRFGFSDQRVLSESLGIPTVSTWVCFENNLITGLFYLLKRSGFLNLLKFRSFKNGMVALFKAITLGSDQWAIRIESKQDGRLVSSQSATASNEAQGTADVTIIVAKMLKEDKFPHGVHHLEEVAKPQEIFDELTAVTFSDNLSNKLKLA